MLMHSQQNPKFIPPRISEMLVRDPGGGWGGAVRNGQVVKVKAGMGEPKWKRWDQDAGETRDE